MRTITKAILLIMALLATTTTAKTFYEIKGIKACAGIEGGLNPNGSNYYAASYFWAWDSNHNIWICLGLQTDQAAKARFAMVLSANANDKTITFGYANERSNLIQGGYHWQIPDFIKLY